MKTTTLLFLSTVLLGGGQEIGRIARRKAAIEAGALQHALEGNDTRARP